MVSFGLSTTNQVSKNYKVYPPSSHTWRRHWSQPHSSLGWDQCSIASCPQREGWHGRHMQHGHRRSTPKSPGPHLDTWDLQRMAELPPEWCRMLQVCLCVGLGAPFAKKVDESQMTSSWGRRFDDSEPQLLPLQGAQQLQGFGPLRGVGQGPRLHLAPEVPHVDDLAVIFQDTNEHGGKWRKMGWNPRMGRNWLEIQWDCVRTPFVRFGVTESNFRVVLPWLPFWRLDLLSLHRCRCHPVPQNSANLGTATSHDSYDSSSGSHMFTLKMTRNWRNKSPILTVSQFVLGRAPGCIPPYFHAQVTGSTAKSRWISRDHHDLIGLPWRVKRHATWAEKQVTQVAVSAKHGGWSHQNNGSSKETEDH